MFLDVIEAKGDDFEDDLKEDFRPGLFFRFIFLCHKGAINFIFHNVVVLKIKQKCKMFLFGGTYLKAGFLFVGLFGEPTSGEGLFAVG